MKFAKRLFLFVTFRYRTELLRTIKCYFFYPSKIMHKLSRISHKHYLLLGEKFIGSDNTWLSPHYTYPFFKFFKCLYNNLDKKIKTLKCFLKCTVKEKSLNK